MTIMDMRAHWSIWVCISISIDIPQYSIDSIDIPQYSIDSIDIPQYSICLPVSPTVGPSMYPDSVSGSTLSPTVINGPRVISTPRAVYQLITHYQGCYGDVMASQWKGTRYQQLARFYYQQATTSIKTVQVSYIIHFLLAPRTCGHMWRVQLVYTHEDCTGIQCFTMSMTHIHIHIPHPASNRSTMDPVMFYGNLTSTSTSHIQPSASSSTS